MSIGPEVQQPQITEIDNNVEFVVDETLKNTGVQSIQKNFKSQVTDDSGNQIISTPVTQVVTVSPPSDSVTLGQQAKGDTTNSLTWLAAFWLRIIKKAVFFGWKIIGKE